MKLNKIASAISVAVVSLALTACGSDDNSSSNAAAQAAAAKARAEAQAAQDAAAAKAKADAEAAAKKQAEEAAAAAQSTSNPKDSPVAAEVVASNPFIGGVNVSKQTTVSSANYLRDSGSNYDRAANPSNAYSRGNVTTLTANVQNPYLSNFLIGFEDVDNDGKHPEAADYIGEYVNPVTKQKERLAGSILGGYEVARLNGDKFTAPAVESKTIQEINAPFVEVADKGKLTPANIRTAFANNGDQGGLSGLVGHKSDINVIGQRSSTTGFYGREEINPTVLAEIRAAEAKANAITDIAEKAKALAELDAKYFGNNGYTFSDTRVFGKNYQALESGVGENQAQKTSNSYKGVYDANGNLTSVDSFKLENVQYGRLTANIDALSKDPTESKTDVSLVYRPTTAHGTARSVDTYFYRGTSETTLAQMAAVKAKGAALQYHGHALTYGIGAFADGGAGANGLPTSFGAGSSQATFGNFVQATYDPTKDTVTGSIYNFKSTKPGDNATPFTKQDLVTFSGQVIGNTVTNGSSVRVVDNDKGSFVASFYGANANELGGNVNSMTAGYENSNAWGAVFGAQAGAAPVTGTNWAGGQFGTVSTTTTTTTTTTTP